MPDRGSPVEKRHFRPRDRPLRVVRQPPTITRETSSRTTGDRRWIRNASCARGDRARRRVPLARTTRRRAGSDHRQTRHGHRDRHRNGRPAGLALTRGAFPRMVDRRRLPRSARDARRPQHPAVSPARLDSTPRRPDRHRPRPFRKRLIESSPSYAGAPFPCAEPERQGERDVLFGGSITSSRASGVRGVAERRPPPFAKD